MIKRINYFTLLSIICMDLFIHKRKKNMHNNEENKLYVMQDVSINYIMLVFT